MVVSRWNGILASVKDRTRGTTLLVWVTAFAPFICGASLSNLQVDSVMPHYMRDYIKCFHYSDACLKIILNKIKNDSIWRNTTLVITGDHAILTLDKRGEFAHYCEESGAPYHVEESYCPLIIYSPQIEKKRIIDNIQCYQMDIYPTIMCTNGGGRFLERIRQESSIGYYTRNRC